jgi:hypothetical protein
MLSARPAALLAALSIRLGVQPLLEAADQEMKLWKDRWNDIEVPENWNVSCLTLLLDADEAYRTRYEKGNLLKSGDRALFDQVVSYKMLENNLDTTLIIRIGWTPEKTKVALGPVVTCRSCEFPRSVTIMGAGGKCGHCLYSEYATPAERESCITAQVKKEDDETAKKTWVECNVRTCRGQYVVYRTENLRVLAKCHYCRLSQKAPTVECTECLNRIIWPKEYRPKGLDAEFKCFACTAGRKTIVDVETTANKLSKENTKAWLIESKISEFEVFNKRSVFYTVSSIGTEKFATGMKLFPEAAGTHLTLKGKLIRNKPSKELRGWVYRRETEAGTWYVFQLSFCFISHKTLV